MSSVHVCALALAPQVARDIRPSALVSILHAGQAVETPAHLASEAHLRLFFDDVLQYDPAATMPVTRHVTELVAFLERWDRTAPLLIHCTQGVSRSPAAALVALGWFNRGREPEAAGALRRAAPFASPNLRFLRLAAEVLAWPALLDTCRGLAPPDRSAPRPFSLDLAVGSNSTEAIWGS